MSYTITNQNPTEHCDREVWIYSWTSSWWHHQGYPQQNTVPSSKISKHGQFTIKQNYLHHFFHENWHRV